MGSTNSTRPGILLYCPDDPFCRPKLIRHTLKTLLLFFYFFASLRWYCFHFLPFSAIKTSSFAKQHNLTSNGQWLCGWVLGINYIFIILDGYIPSRRRVRRLAESSAESRTGAACRSCTTPQSAADLPLPYSWVWRARVEAPRRPAGALLSWVTRTLQQIKLINFPGFVMCFQCWLLLVKSKEKEGQTTRIRDIYLSSCLMLSTRMRYQRANTFIGILKAFGCNLCPWLSLL